MRHGPAEDDASDGLDSSRALTPAGRERCRSVAKRLVELNESPRAIVSSPLVRALQTAEIVHTIVSPAGSVEANRAFAPHGHAHDFVREAAKHGRKRMMVVGHEPDLSLLCARLLGDHLSYGFMKAMVISLRVPNEGGPAGLRFILEPKTLQFLVDARGGGPASE